MSDSVYRKLALFTLLLCFGIVVLGAYVRLSDAGLGCPDWPGCYGHIGVPDHEVAADHESGRPLEPAKAWKEMIHRYFASSLGLLIIALAVFGWRRGLPRWALAGLVGLVCFQGILGMWTVTWQLKPAAVSAHLLGGMSTLAVLAWLNLRLRPKLPRPVSDGGTRVLAAVALVVLFGQLFLGGWTSSNYAALACPDFPTCHAQWWPDDAEFGEAFVLWRGLGINYEYGVLDSPARTAIHFAHRLGALLTTLLMLVLAARLWALPGGRGFGAAVALATALQVTLGIAAVWLGLPLAVAAAHNAGAALLVITLVTVNQRLRAWP